MISNDEFEYQIADSAAPIKAENGQVLGVILVFSDVSEKYLAEQKIKESEKQFRSLFKNMIDGSAVHELVFNEEGIPVDYRIVEVNPAYEKLLGISRLDVIGKNSCEAFDLSEPLFFDIYSKVVLTGQSHEFEAFFPPLNKHFYISVYHTQENGFATIFEDITEQKKAKENLRINLTKYKTLFDSFPLGITVSDSDRNIIESNSIAEELLGLSSVNQQKRKIQGTEWEIIKNDGTIMHASEFSAVRALKEGRLVTNVEMGFVKEDKVTWLNVSAFPIKLKGYGVMIAYNDITEKVNAENALKAEQQFSINIMDSLPRIFYLYSYPQLRLVLWNKNHETIFGYKESELRNMQVYKWYNPKAKRVAELAMEKVIANGYNSIETSLYTNDGRAIPFILNGVRIQQGNKQLIAGMEIDISDRIKAEIKLKESEVQYRNLADSGMALIWRSGINKLCNYFNEPWLNFTGRTPEQEMGNGWAKGVHSEDLDRCLETYVAAFDKQEAFSMEYRFKHHSGEYKWILDQGTPNFNVDGEFVGYIGYCFDISKNKEAETEIKKQNKKLKQLNIEKDKFFSIVAHDLKSPFNIFLGYTEMMVDELDKMSLKQIQIIAIEMKKSANNLYDLLENLLHWSRIKQGIIGFNPSVFALNTIIGKSTESIIVISSKKEITIKSTILDTLKVYADVNMLESIIRNLVTNAVKFTAKGGSIEINAKLNLDLKIFH